MIEALIRDDKRLICLVSIRPGPDKESLNVDIFLPGQGKTLSGVMPAGGEPAQQVARAVMTVYPISALPTDAYQVALEKRRKEMVERENARREGKPADSNKDGRSDLEIAACIAIGKRNLELNEREADLSDHEKKLEQDIENLRKSHPDR